MRNLGSWVRRAGAGMALGMALVGVCGTGAASEEGVDRPPAAAGPEMITPETDKAIHESLDWLAAQQHPDGSFGSNAYSGNIAVTSLAGLAFMSAGYQPGEGKFGDVLDKTIGYVLDHTDAAGFITAAPSESHGPMYSHGFGTLFLAESYGMTQRPEIREKLKKAVHLIINTQNAEGGWRYQPKPIDADISVTICQIMALRAARNAGIFVPKETVDRCIRYVRQSQNADGGFRYMLHGGGSAFPRSAAGVVALYSAGIYEGKEIQRGLEYLSHSMPEGRFGQGYSHYFYGHYYAVQAMWQAGGKYWEHWYPMIRDELLQRRSSQGYWQDSICREYGTAMACIILQMPNNYLPIFQR